MQWTPSLANLVREAHSFQQECWPHTCVLLKMLCATTTEECAEFDNGRLDEDAVVARLSIRLGVPEREIANLFSREILNSLWDHADSYSDLMERFRASKKNEADLLRTIGAAPNREKGKAFVLYETIRVWCPEESSLYMDLIENDDFFAICRGCLIKIGAAYPTALHLLQASYRENWPKWEAMWEIFY